MPDKDFEFDPVCFGFFLNLSKMAGISFLGYLLPSIGYLELDEVIHRLPPILSGIVLCSIVYKLTGFISLRCFKAYRKLSKAEKVEWNNRGFSTVHAIVVAFASFYLLIVSDLFQENSHDRLIVERTSTLSNTILGISTGYFVSDIAMILWHFPALGGLEYVLHHELSMFAIVLSLMSEKAQIYIFMVLFTESTTPFVNLRWYLDVASKKNSTLYVINGVALFVGWLIARVLLFVYFFIHMLAHFDQVKTIFPLGFYTVLVVPSVLSKLNLFWFWKITKGLIKTLSKAKHN